MMGTGGKDMLDWCVRQMYGLDVEPKRIIFNDPATVVFWDDGTKTVVRCQNGDEFSREHGLLYAYMKRMYGNTSRYNNVLRRWMDRAED